MMLLMPRELLSIRFTFLFRYPFSASEIFTCDASSIIEQFLTEVNLNPESEDTKETTQSGDKETSITPTKESEEAPKVESEQSSTEAKLDNTNEDKLEIKDLPVPEENPIPEEELGNKEKLPAEEVEKKENAEFKVDEVKEADKEEVKAGDEEDGKKEEADNENDDKPIPEESPIDEKKFTLKAEDTPSESAPQPDADEEKTNEGDQVLQGTPEKAKIPRYLLLDKLLSILATEEEVNSVLAGYFSKVFNAILERHTNDVLTYIFHYNTHIKNILKHSYNKSISDVLNKLVSFDDRGTGDTPEDIVEKKKELLVQIVDKMSPNNSIDCITNACYTLCNIADNKQRLDYFFSKGFLEKIFEYARSDNWMSLRGALTLLIVLYRVKASSGVSEPPAFLGFAAPDDGTEEELPEFSDTLNMSINYLDFAKKYLENPNNNPKLSTASGNELIPFGLDRLKVIEWIQALISLKEGSVGERLSELNFGVILLSLITKYDMNSILHNKIFSAFKSALDLHMAAYTSAVLLIFTRSLLLSVILLLGL